MTTQIQGKRLKEAYRLALCTGGVARYRETFRDGRIVAFRIDDDTGFSDGLSVENHIELAGHYQLHYHSQHRGQPSTNYAVYGRMADSKRHGDWIVVDGPWPVGDGPFDNPRRKFP